MRHIKRSVMPAVFCVSAIVLSRGLAIAGPPNGTQTKSTVLPAIELPDESKTKPADPVIRPQRPDDPFWRDREVANKYRAVTEIVNRTDSEINYAIRWKRWDGSWTAWKKFKTAVGRNWTHSMRGATTGEIAFDRYVNDQKTTAHIVTLAVTRVPSSHDWKNAGPQRMAFYFEGTMVKLYTVNRVAEDAALKRKGIVTSSNLPDDPSVPYRLRWRRFDGRWTAWKTHRVKTNYDNTHSFVGAKGCEVQFDRIGGDKKFTSKTYALALNMVSRSKYVTKNDGRRFHFKYTGRTRLDLHRN